ncbi:MAG: DUF971 domain-containing protein [Ignavibacteriales bacterium]|nr:MAG: DUF971 domain-containing protein [Ignavibacteriales bacterium]
MFPALIKLVDKKKLKIVWSDNQESLISLVELRKLCPCATCDAERDNQSKTFIPIFSTDQITPLKIKQVGTYAITINWKDGHSTGIYEFPFLRRISSVDGEN